MYCTTLIPGFWKHFRNAFWHIKALVSNDETNAFKPTLFQPYKEVFPAFVIFLHAFGGAKDFAMTLTPST